MAQLILDLPETLYKRANQLSELTGMSVESVIMQLLGESLPPLSSEMVSYDFEALNDAEILEIAESMMNSLQNARFSILQEKQREGTLTEFEHAELQLLFNVFKIGQLDKVKAMLEAKKRGLLE